MASRIELQTLKEEEKVLIKISSKLSDQLNRLKVEELDLLSQIRAKQQSVEEESSTNELVINSTETNEEQLQTADMLLLDMQPDLDLGMNEKDTGNYDEVESDDESTEHDQLTAFMKQLADNQR